MSCRIRSGANRGKASRVTSAISAQVSRRARVPPNRAVKLMISRPGGGDRAAPCRLPPTMHSTGQRPGGQGEYAARDLALERRRIEVALAGDHQVGPGEALGQPGHAGHQVEAGHDAGAEGDEPPGQPPGGPRAGNGVDVHPEVPPVTVGQGAEAIGQKLDLLR